MKIALFIYLSELSTSYARRACAIRVKRGQRRKQVNNQLFSTIVRYRESPTTADDIFSGILTINGYFADPATKIASIKFGLTY